MAAGAAEGQRRVAAPVEEQQRLLAGRRVSSSGRAPAAATASRADPAGGGVFARRSISPIVGSAGAAVTLRQGQAPVAAGLTLSTVSSDGVAETSTTGIPRGGAHHRHVAGVVDDAFVLLEAGVVLLVDDDQPQVAIGQEQRRPRADDQLCASPRSTGPPVAPALRLERSECHSAAPPKRAAETVEPVGGQRDLGQQDQHLSVRPQRRGDGFEIDLGLAGPGDAVEQGDRISAVDGGDAFAARGGLGVRQNSTGSGLDQAGRPARLPERRSVSSAPASVSPG